MKFSATLPGVAVIGFLAVTMPMALLAVLLHESGHIFTALCLNVAIKELGVCGKGPFIRRSPSLVQNHELMIASAGIVVNLILAMMFPGGRFAVINWILVVSNLIPFFGSDGQRIVRILKAARKTLT
jgi:Zn-dependent protease